MFFQALPKTVYEEQFFKWKHQSYLIHVLRSATENTLRPNGELSTGNNHPEQQNWLQEMEKTPGGRSVKEQTLKKNNNSAKNVALTII